MLAGARVSIASGSRCPFVPTSRHLTRNGWKVKARWDHCGALRKVRLRASIDSACQRMDGQVRARGASVESRTFKYCSEYDNGFRDPTEVKRAS